MSSLLLQQQALMDALWQDVPSAPGWHATARGLDAYRANARALAERCLRATYPVTIELIGETNAAPLAHRLWRTDPPRRGDIAHWGAGLPGLLSTTEGLSDLRWLADVARVEWALHRAATATDVESEPSGLARLAREDPYRLTLRLASGVAVIQSAWPVASLVTAHLHGAPDLATVGGQIQRGERENALVWRPDWRPTVRACSDGEAALVLTLLRGAHLPDALDAAGAAHPDFDFSLWLPLAVQSGLVCGVTDVPFVTHGDPP